MIKSSINIKTSFFNVTKSAIGSSSNILKKAILKRTKVKKEKIARSKLFDVKKAERKKREEKEDLLENKSKVETQGPLSKVSSTAKNFLESILDFLGILLIGWAVNNLPNIIKMVENLISRINLLFQGLKNFIENITKWFKGIFGLVTGTLENWRNFDFTDQSGKIKAAMKEMEDAVKGIEKAFEDAKTAVGGDMGEVSAAGGGSLNAADVIADTPEEKAFIATVRELEGTGGSGGYNTVYGGAVVPKLSQMSLGELYDAIKLGGTDRLPDRLGGGIIPFKKDRYNSSASGALQIMPETLRGLVERGQFKWDDTFSPETQNKMILALARNGGVDIEKMTDSQMYKASKIWAGLGTFHGQTDRTSSQSLEVYNQNLKEAKKPKGAGDGRKSRGANKSSAYNQAVTVGRSLLDKGYKPWQHPDFNLYSGYTGSGRERVMMRGYRSYHNYGEALDYPLSHNSEAQLDNLAAFFRQNKAKLGIAEILWKTSGHYDHLHVSFSGGEGISRPVADIPMLQGQQQQQQIIIIDEESQETTVIPADSGGGAVIMSGDSLNRFMRKKLLLELAYT